MSEKKINLLIDAHLFDEELYQGSKTMLLGLLNNFPESLKKYFNIFLAAYDTDNLKNIFGSNYFKFIKLKSKNRLVRLLIDYPNIIKNNKINVSYFQYIIPFINRHNFIVSIHDILFEDFPNDYSWSFRKRNSILFKRSAKKSDLIHTVSHYSKERLIHHYNINEDKIFVIPNGVGKQFFEDKNKKVSRKYIHRKYGIQNFILYVSRIEPRKNHEFLLKLFKKLLINHNNLKLVLIGSKSMKNPNLDKEIKYLTRDSVEMKNSIFFFENISQDDLIEFYNACEIFIYPSRSEGFGIPPIEASALGVPTLCSNKTAMQEFTFLKDYFINIYDFDSTFAKVESCIEKIEKNEQRFKEIKNIVRNNYNWEVISYNFFLLLYKKYGKI